jgi:phage baseplate assembly protein gpV
MSTIVGIIQQIVQEELRRVRVAELAVVTATYPHSSNGNKDNYACDVQLKGTGLGLKKVPVATQRVGTVAIPNPGDLVLLAFDKGDVNQPIIIGRLYNDQDRPPLSKENEVIFRLPLDKPDAKTVKMEARNLKGKSPPREVLLELAPELKVRVVDTELHATVGRTGLTLKTRKGGKSGQVIIEARRSKVIINQDGDISIVAAKKMNLIAKDTMSLKAKSILLNAQEGINLTSKRNTIIQAQTGKVTVKGKTGVVLKSDSTATVEGLTTKVKGTMTTVEGTMTTVEGEKTTLKGKKTDIVGLTSFSPV